MGQIDVLIDDPADSDLDGGEAMEKQYFFVPASLRETGDYSGALPSGIKPQSCRGYTCVAGGHEPASDGGLAVRKTG